MKNSFEKYILNQTGNVTLKKRWRMMRMLHYENEIYNYKFCKFLNKIKTGECYFFSKKYSLYFKV